MRFPRLLTRIDLELTRIDCRIDLPHASVTSRSQKPVSVIIRCKHVKTESVENVRRMPCAESMRRWSQEQLAA